MKGFRSLLQWVAFFYGQDKVTCQNTEWKMIFAAVNDRLGVPSPSPSTYFIIHSNHIMALAKPTPPPLVARESDHYLVKKQFNIFSFFDPASSTSSSDGDTSDDGGGTTSSTTTTTSSSSSSSTTTSSSSSTTSSSSSSAVVTSFTSTSSSTFVTHSTSNGVITSFTVTTASVDVVTSTAANSASTSTHHSSSSNGGLIGGVVGGVVGGLALLTLLVLSLIVWHRRKSRTGHGWFLCFGRRPDHGDELDVDWPTFDPTAGAAGVGGSLGASGSRRRNNGYNGGTLPNVEGEDVGYGGYEGNGMGEYGSYQAHEEMRDTGAGYPTSAPSYTSPTSDGTHYRQQSQQWMTPYSNTTHQSAAPDYSHLDAPEVREERAREQAQAQALAAAAAAAGSGAYTHSNSGSPPLSGEFSSSARTTSPPLNEGRPLSSGHINEHRFSQGTAQMLTDNNFFMSPSQYQHFDDGSGTVINEGPRHGLHIQNPDDN